MGRLKPQLLWNYRSHNQWLSYMIVDYHSCITAVVTTILITTRRARSLKSPQLANSKCRSLIILICPNSIRILNPNHFKFHPISLDIIQICTIVYGYFPQFPIFSLFFHSFSRMFALVFPVLHGFSGEAPRVSPRDGFTLWGMALEPTSPATIFCLKYSMETYLTDGCEVD